MKDLYRTLEVDPAASPEVIAAAYRVLAKKLHPDATGTDSTGSMVDLNRAYETLRDPGSRAAYDRTRQPSSEPFIKVKVRYMRFGKYRGLPMSEVPTDYLLWVVDNVERSGDVFDASEELTRRGYY